MTHERCLLTFTTAESMAFLKITLKNPESKYHVGYCQTPCSHSNTVQLNWNIQMIGQNYSGGQITTSISILHWSSVQAEKQISPTILKVLTFIKHNYSVGQSKYN